MNDKELFKAAYDAVGRGRSFVRIHRLRDYLGWTRERFNAVLVDLKRAYVVQLQGGDPSIMTDQELRDSYKDEKGRLRIVVCWLGGGD